MPRAQDLARQNRAEIDSVKAAGAGAVMRCAATDKRLLCLLIIPYAL